MAVNFKDKETQIVLQPFKHIRRRGLEHKNMVVRFWWATNHWTQVQGQKLQDLARISTALLDLVDLLDDIFDYAILRRGMPSSYLVYGIPSTVYSVMYCTGIVVEQLRNLGKDEAIDCFIKLGIKLYYGYSLEDYYRTKCICPNEDQYIEIALHRGSWPVRCPTELLELFSDHLINLEDLCIIYGIIASIANDHATFSDGYATRKTFCDDVTGGIFNLPIIHGISCEKDGYIMNLMKERTTDYEKKKHLVKLLGQYGSLEYSKRILLEYKAKALKEAEKFEPNPVFQNLLEEICQNLDKESFYDYCE